MVSPVSDPVGECGYEWEGSQLAVAVMRVARNCVS